MGSDCVVPVVEIKNVREHPGADLLSIVEVLGYQMVTGLVEDPEGSLTRYFLKGERDERGRRVPCNPIDLVGSMAMDSANFEEIRYNFRYVSGDKAVYFPADTLLTDEWAVTFDVKHLLRGKEQNRVGRQRLRGEPSFGLIVEVPAGQDWELGFNAAEHFDAEKYVPPARSDPGDIAPYDSDVDPLFVPYTDIQNGKLLYDKFLENEEVVATEKIHGANSRVGLVNGLLVAGSRTTRKVKPEPDKDLKDYLFWSPLVAPGVEQLLHNIWNDQEAFNANVVIVFGEVYGQGVQSLHYGQNKQKGFRAFDIYVNGDYLDYAAFAEQCKMAGVEMAPVLYRGPFDLDKIQEVADGRSTLPGADNIREGVVVRPVLERRDPALGRVVLKFIGTEYELSKHKKKDTTDV